MHKLMSVFHTPIQEMEQENMSIMEVKIEDIEQYTYHLSLMLEQQLHVP